MAFVEELCFGKPLCRAGGGGAWQSLGPAVVQHEFSQSLLLEFGALSARHAVDYLSLCGADADVLCLADDCLRPLGHDLQLVIPCLARGCLRPLGHDVQFGLGWWVTAPSAVVAVPRGDAG